MAVMFKEDNLFESYWDGFLIIIILKNDFLELILIVHIKKNIDKVFPDERGPPNSFSGYRIKLTSPFFPPLELKESSSHLGRIRCYPLNKMVYD